MKSVIILGSTGSIGRNTLEVIQQHQDKYKVKVLTAHSNAVLLAKQAKRFSAESVVIIDSTKLKILEMQLVGSGIKIYCGIKDLLDIAKEEYDIGICAIVGIAGLRPTVALFNATTVVGLASKESIVCAGKILDQIAANTKAHMLPIDSEHVGILQVLESDNVNNVTKITLTASGGPFREYMLHEMESVTPEEATRHPIWRMGKKITVDCATMANKGFEVIETCKLFDIPSSKVDIIIHPEAVIHSMVTYNDGATLAQMAMPSMTIPISHVLAYPKRTAIKHDSIDFINSQKWTFEAPDFKRFPLLKLVVDLASENEGKHTVLNTSNEVAVEAFLEKQISFTNIYRVVSKCCEAYRGDDVTSIEEVIELDIKIRSQSKDIISNL